MVELKRDSSPRDVTAQIIDYASWVRHLGYQDVKELYEASDEHDDTFEAGFDSVFYPAQDDTPAGPEEVNNQHMLTIVSSELDSSTERIIEYLSDEFEVPINAVRFNYYKEEGENTSLALGSKILMKRKRMRGSLRTDTISTQISDRINIENGKMGGNTGLSPRSW